MCRLSQPSLTRALYLKANVFGCGIPSLAVSLSRREKFLWSNICQVYVLRKMPRGSKRPPDFQFYPTAYPSDKEDGSSIVPPALPDAAHHKHVHFHHESGQTQTSYISSLASPSKQREISPEAQTIWNTEPLPNFETHPYVDPAYQHELDLQDELSKRKRTKSDTPLLNWIPDVDIFLKEILRLEGRGNYAQQDICGFCEEDMPAEYRCRDCLRGELYCQRCTLLLHSRNPLHRIQKWNGMFFERTSLKSIGLRVQLGHSLGDLCSNPEPSYKDTFTVIDVKGIHQVHLDYCSCELAQPRHIQLLRFSWYPATSAAPRTAATFRVLELFHLLTFESKASGFALYNTLSRSTDNTGASPPPVRYCRTDILRLCAWFANGVISNYSSVQGAGTNQKDQGQLPVSKEIVQLYVLHVLIQDATYRMTGLKPRIRSGWLYALFLAIDANFRLKRKEVSSDAADPSLNRGRAYFVEEHRYKEHLAGYGDQEETTSDCVNHDAVKSANKYTAGLAATGAGTVDCARHNMKRPHVVGDLQAGERQSNMDYLFLTSILGCALLIMNISYDICCQWGIHLRTQMAEYPEEYWVDLTRVAWVFLVPKFHLPAHIERCQTTFSFNFTWHVGRTDGEAPERGWADINAAAGSTQEMGPGSRQDTLDDHFGDWNHRKIVAMAPTFLRKIKAAVPERADHIEVFEDLSENLPPESVAAWTVAVEAWERCLRTAMGELTVNSTSVQRTKIQLRANTLQRKIDAWIKVQEIYIPATAVLRAGDPSTTLQGAPEVAPHLIPLLLPSSLPPRTIVAPKLLQYEWRLRQAQARDAVFSLRRNLRVQAHMFTFKTRFHRGQAANTRSSDTITRVRAKVAESAALYRTARTAIAHLGRRLKETGWARAFPLLQEEDVRQMTEGLEGESEGKRTMSWIWTTAGVGGEKDTADSAQEELRIEWCKARARAFRWSEEVFLLLEEMTRVRKYHTWHAEWWEQQSVTRPGLSAEESEGFAAYAFRQAQIRITMRDVCVSAWKDVERYVTLGIQLEEATVDADEDEDDEP
ncbi:hypothetical protein HWV62_24332 [Athelia sp. TMB]|nr:hypothetical protein HWV62_24332 [Athelia sp. TMB]